MEDKSMIDSINRITLDMHDTASQVMINIKKNDSCRQIHITLTDSGKSYRIEYGCSATFRARKPDGTILYNKCNIEGNVIKYVLTNQTSASVGLVECEVTLYGSDNRQITSPRFTLCVEDTIYSDSEVESTDEFTELSEAVTCAKNVDLELVNVEKGADITITDRYGIKHTTTILNGEKGDRGEKGDKGIQGERGETGTQGVQGVQGVQGNPGRDGINGVAVSTIGCFAFNVTQGGMLQVTYTGEDAPDIELREDGHIYLTL